MSAQRAAGVVLLALSAGYTALAARIEPAFAATFFVLGPRTFPLAIGIAGVVLSLILVAASRAPAASATGGSLGAPAPAPSTGGGSSGAAAPGTAAAPARALLGGEWRPTLALCVLALLYAAALPRVGFALSSAAFLSAAFRLLGERRAAVLTVVPLATAAVLLAVLRGALGVHLPDPIWELLLAAAAPPR